MEKGQFKDLSVPVKWNIGRGKLSGLLLVKLENYQMRSENEQLALNQYDLFLNITNSFWYCELCTLMSVHVSNALL
jgi:hypothetical protein